MLHRWPAAGRFLAGIVAEGGDPVPAIRALRVEKKPIPGFGHPQHSGGDPRANLLLALAAEHGIEGPHIAALRRIEAALPEIVNRPLPINVNGAIPAVMLDVGFPLAALQDHRHHLRRALLATFQRTGDLHPVDVVGRQ